MKHKIAPVLYTTRVRKGEPVLIKHEVGWNKAGFPVMLAANTQRTVVRTVVSTGRVLMDTGESWYVKRNNDGVLETVNRI